jgi:hypothetical protein
MSFSRGKVSSSPDCYTLYEGGYSAGGAQFKDIQMTANTNASTPTHAGEVDFTLSGDMLEIDSTSAGQFQPVPLTVCQLRKFR